MEDITHIYTISDENNNIRYIGKSDQPKRRLHQHITIKSNQDKYDWIQSIIENGSNPIIEIIDSVPVLEWHYWEKYWIEQFKVWGFNLLNISKGGVGGEGYHHTDEAKEIMRQSKLGKPLLESTRLKISLSGKEKHKTNPNYNHILERKIIIDKDKLYDLYITQNLSLPKIADMLDVSQATVCENLKDYNIKKDKTIWRKQCGDNHRKIVLQYDMNSNFIKEWDSVRSIANELGYNRGNLAATCRGLNKTCMGYIWKYKDNI